MSQGKNVIEFSGDGLSRFVCVGAVAQTAAYYHSHLQTTCRSSSYQVTGMADPATLKSDVPFGGFHDLSNLQGLRLCSGFCCLGLRVWSLLKLDLASEYSKSCSIGRCKIKQPPQLCLIYQFCLAESFNAFYPPIPFPKNDSRENSISICDVVEIASSSENRSWAGQAVSHVDGLGIDVPWFHVRKFRSIAGWL